MAHTPPGRTREKVFRFVRGRLLEGAPPTVREVQDAMGFGAVESARKQLEALVAEGRLVKTPGRARGYRLPDAPVPAASVPLLGRIQAGDLTAAIEDPNGWVVADGRRDNAGEFALEVRGESMRDAGILPGDVVIVRRQESAESGDIVVALIDDEATVKRLRRHRGAIWLEPANPAFEPIRPAPGTMRLLGRVVELRRRFD